MNIAKLAINRPILISSIVALILILGLISYHKIGMELLPDMTFPTLGVTTIYKGASPEEIEQLITKPLEDQLGTLSGLKHLSSQNIEGLSIITLEFNMEVNIDVASQDVRDKINVAKNNLPDDLEDDPLVEKFDPDSNPVMRIALISDQSPSEIYDIAKEIIKPQIERIQDVGSVKIIGGTRREIQVEIDQNRLNEYQIPMIQVVNQIKSSGKNIPVGKKENGLNQTLFRSMGEFNSLKLIEDTMISFSGDIGNSVSVRTFGAVKDGVEDAASKGYIYYPSHTRDSSIKDKKVSSLYLDIIRQTGTNTVKVTARVKDNLAGINENLKKRYTNSKVEIITDQSRWVKINVDEAVFSIELGILLAVLVVYLFLGNIRSTIITAIAIPNSLLGAVILMNTMGYTFNVMTLMALSLVVGLLVDDAIVVRENIFRKLENGDDSFTAAEHGTTEVMLAVIATTLAILSVFFPIGMLSGVIGKLFKQFGFTVIFALVVSLFDALTVAPFLSAYFAGDGKKADNIFIRGFEKFQDKMDKIYIKIMGVCLNHPLMIILITLFIFITSLGLLPFVKKTFMPSTDMGEFGINIDMPAGSSIDGTEDTLNSIIEKIKNIPDIAYLGVTAGTANGEITKGDIFCALKKDRKSSTDENKEKIRIILKEFAYARPTVNNTVGGPPGAPYSLVLSGNDLKVVEEYAAKIMEKVKSIPDLIDVDSTLKKGSPELRIVYNPEKMMSVGASNIASGTELRYNIEGEVVGQYREKNIDYDIRARLKPSQRDLKKTFNETRIPNKNNRLIPLNLVAENKLTTGYTKIFREDREYIVKITANLNKNGAVGNAMEQTRMIIKEVSLPSSLRYRFSGQSETFSETASSVIFALIMAIVFIYLILSSLYESFVTPVTILLAIPPALTGAFFALFLSGFMLDMYSMIGLVMLMGLVTKNSILLVDNIMHGVNSGLGRKEAILQAGERRLRPILMTTFAMIAGMFPLAIGFGEAAQMRQSMGISILGGVIISTLITLIVVPAVFEYVDRFRVATESRILVRRK